MAIQQEIGQLGEDIAVKYLKNKGYSIIERNYWKKWGEIDIVAEKACLIHFVEVKSVSYVTPNTGVTYETPAFDPQDHMNKEKMHRLNRVIETYLADKDMENEWQVDLMLVYLNKSTKTAKVNLIENITL
ncbi:MAG TPA: YraN family protein [Candidatus Paceibacterota bacterium]|nr:YraN family protein [Candidatus Paceibacterota bacterium]